MWGDGLGIAATEMAQGPPQCGALGTAGAADIGDEKLSASSSSGYPGIKCGVQRVQFSASSSSGHPGIRCGVQHQRSVTAASGVAQSG